MGGTAKGMKIVAGALRRLMAAGLGPGFRPTDVMGAGGGFDGQGGNAPEEIPPRPGCVAWDGIMNWRRGHTQLLKCSKEHIKEKIGPVIRSPRLRVLRMLPGDVRPSGEFSIPRHVMHGLLRRFEITGHRRCGGSKSQ
jgi:hypothetical protein